MSKRKTKLKLTPQSWVWLAKSCAQQEWERVQDLAKISAEAAVAYVEALTSPEIFEQFEETFRPEVVAARKKEAERRESLTIHTDGSGYDPHANLKKGSTAPLWRDATLTEAERQEAAKLAEEERTGTRAIPEIEFDPL
ncbi:MAG TPA: hypothetical protein VFO46_06040 [Candidatus Sulfotelmatobacter sp.]|nr:hypothetical protein [Candidatus Sulfotelmatobacter sp.]